jgi:hypothetical protein
MMAAQERTITLIFDGTFETLDDADVELLEFSAAIAEEAEEIAELRKLVTETVEPEPGSYTST